MSADSAAVDASRGGPFFSRFSVLDEDTVAALCRSPHPVSVYPVCFAVQDVPTEHPFAGLVHEVGPQQQQHQ